VHPGVYIDVITSLLVLQLICISTDQIFKAAVSNCLTAQCRWFGSRQQHFFYNIVYNFSKTTTSLDCWNNNVHEGPFVKIIHVSNQLVMQNRLGSTVT